MKLKKFKFICSLAKRDLVEDKHITLIVVAMLSFSFLNLAFFPAFVSGLTDVFNSSIIETDIGHVSISPEDSYLENAESLVKKVSKLKGVEEIEKRIEETVVLSYKNEEKSVQVIGSSTPDSKFYNSRIQKGTPVTSDEEKKIGLGDSVGEAEDGIDVDIGRKITMTSERLDYMEEYKVKNLVGRAGPGGLTRQAVIPYSDVEEMIGKENVATSIKILLKDGNPKEFKLALQKLNINGEIETWREQSDMASSIEQTFSLVTFVISLVGVIIALTSIGVVIFINTNKRSREMGIVRAIGTESNQVVKIFVLEAFILGLAGVIVGNILLIGLDTYLASHPIPSPLGPLSTVVTAELLWTRTLVMLVSSLIAGFIPAYMISKDNIVETIEKR